MTAKLRFRRKAGGIKDRARSYRVHVDGQRLATLKPGGEFEADVPAGSRTVDVSIDWKHHRLDLSVADGDVVTIVCSPRPYFRSFGDMLPGRPWLNLRVER